MELRRRVAENLAVSVGGKLAAGVLGVAAIGFATRALGSSAFGEYSLVLSLLYIISVVGGFGLDALLTKEISRPGANEQDALERLFFARFFFLAVSLAVGSLIVFALPYSAAVKFGVALAGIGAVAFSLAQALTGVFQKHLITKIPAFSEAGIRALQLAGAAALFYSGGGLAGFLGLFALGGIAYLGLVYRAAAARTGLRLRVRFDGVARAVRDGWPLAAAAILTLVYFRGDTIILSLMHPAHDVGIYSVAYKVLEQAIYFPIMFAGLVLPLLASSYGVDAGRFRAVFQKAFDFLAVSAFPFALGGIYLAPDIVRLLAGGAFTEAALPLQLLFVAILFIFFGALLGNTIIAMGKQRTVMWVYGAAAVSNIALNLYFIARYSYVGAAAVTAATELFVSLAMGVIVARGMREAPSFSVFAKSALAALAMFAVLALSPWQNAVFLVALGAVAYVGIMYLWGGISKNDLLLFFRRSSV